MSMSAQTVAQKIIARAAGRGAVEAGEYVTVTPDYTCCQELFWPGHKRNLERIGVDRIPRPDKAVMVIDHSTAAAMGSHHHETHRTLRDWCERQGIENFFGPGNGLRHQVLTERGFARPGTLIFSDEGNIASIGALGALNIPISTEVLVSLIQDENWLAVPPSARITLTGGLGFGVTARDVIQTILRDATPDGRLLQCCVEFDGPGLVELSLDDRQTLLASLFHSGAYTGVMEPDALALAYVAARAAGRPWHVVKADPGADYAARLTYDLGAIAPLVTVPPDAHGAVPVAEVAGTRIDQASIGSCAGGRLDDLRAAARILRGRRIASHVTLYVTPGSRGIYAEAAREGLLEILAEAGAAILAPGCTTCWGYQGVLNDGEVSISTQQFNYQGRNGSRSAHVFLGGPYVVAASAVAGRIVDPRPMLAEAGAA
ncbi:3-isopropylmalate dehydratase [Roseomonas hellenica]|uniref:3-isopropylmalate dehydratase n=1 Tax=Plastoroseomonas hellenica TaxID=2687306 RepID=A0ABS5F0G5_9PROT|nr:aconitase family protein [Plastoroseomonas hellenica]MBR0666035.1 3-isopropylmalate dehydratase [Plastoroseomonas hellenica]